MRRRIHNTLIVVDRYLRLMGDKTIPDSAEPRLESFYPPFAPGIDLPHQGVVDSYILHHGISYISNTISLYCGYTCMHMFRLLSQGTWVVVLATSFTPSFMTHEDLLSWFPPVPAILGAQQHMGNECPRRQAMWPLGATLEMARKVHTHTPVMSFLSKSCNGTSLLLAHIHVSLNEIAPENTYLGIIHRTNFPSITINRLLSPNAHPHTPNIAYRIVHQIFRVTEKAPWLQCLGSTYSAMWLGGMRWPQE